MKKTLLISIALFVCNSLFAISYKDNIYQKTSEEYAAKAKVAYEAGDYETAVECAAKSKENAELSQKYILGFIAEQKLDEVMKAAAERIAYAKSIDADKNFPIAFSAANDAYAAAEKARDEKDYSTALDCANQVLASLADIKEMTPLPQFYVVRPWATSKDCYWNISGRSFVYNNPFLWENLYQANKDNMEKPNDPNLIHPGMKMKIPSLTGEYREGTYSPSKKYDPYGKR